MMPIGELARKAGLASSAIRYYERRGLLPRPERRSGRRVYDESALARLAAIGFAQEAGFTLSEIEELASRFPTQRWRALAVRKLAEIEESAARLSVARAMLEGVLSCGCFDLEQCGRLVLERVRARRPPRPGREATSRSRLRGRERALAKGR